MSYRVCSVCGKVFGEGYIAGNGRYFCSDVCLHEEYTEEEWLEEYTGLTAEEREADKQAYLDMDTDEPWDEDAYRTGCNEGIDSCWAQFWDDGEEKVITKYGERAILDSDIMV